jgi:hypothetical protein
LKFMFALLLAGLSPLQATDFLHGYGAEAPGKHEMFAAEEAVCAAMIERSITSTRTMGMMLPAGTVLAYDGSWAHRRGADQCFEALIAITPDPSDPAKGKVVEYAWCSGSSVSTGTPTTSGRSRRWILRLRWMIPRWKDNPNIGGVCARSGCEGVSADRGEWLEREGVEGPESRVQV